MNYLNTQPLNLIFQTQDRDEKPGQLSHKLSFTKAMLSFILQLKLKGEKGKINQIKISITILSCAKIPIIRQFEIIN